MPASEEHYDDSAFTYFALSVLAIILVPSTLAYIKIWRKGFSTKYTGSCGCQACRSKAKELQIESRKPSTWGFTKFILYILCIILFIFFLKKATSESVPTSQTAFDPYVALELDYGASEEEIKKAYRKLSLKWHPDKNTEEGASEKFIEISKAHKTLTDPETREKWEKYGNPDGPQGYSVGIALPSFLVDSQNSNIVLAIYVAFLVIIFPTVAICWWSRQKELAYNQLNIRTMQRFYILIKETHRFKKLVPLLCLAEEYISLIQLRRSDELVLKKIQSQIPEVEIAKKKNSEKSKKPNKLTIPPHAIKNTMLLYAHFSRLHDNLDYHTSKDLDLLLRKCHTVISGMVEISSGKKWLVPTLEAIQLGQMLTQAVWSESSKCGRNSSILQLPHLSNNHLNKLSSKKWRDISDLQDFIDPDNKEERNEFLKSEGLTNSQIEDIDTVIHKFFPIDVKWKLACGIEGEDDPNPADAEEAKDSKDPKDPKDSKDSKDSKPEEKKSVETANKLGITANSVVTLTVSFTRPSYPGGKLEDAKENLKVDEKQKIDVHAPHYPNEKKEHWWIIVGDESNKIVTLPKKITALRDGTSVKLPFLAPKKPGNYQIVVHLLCDSYVGFDKRETIKLNVGKEVKPPEPVRNKDDEDYNSEEDLSGEEDDEKDEEKKKLLKEKSSNNGKDDIDLSDDSD